MQRQPPWFRGQSWGWGGHLGDFLPQIYVGHKAAGPPGRMEPERSCPQTHLERCTWTGLPWLDPHTPRGCSPLMHSLFYYLTQPPCLILVRQDAGGFLVPFLQARTRGPKRSADTAMVTNQTLGPSFVAFGVQISWSCMVLLNRLGG